MACARALGPRHRALLVGLQASPRSTAARRPHLLRDAEIADPELPEHGLHVVAEAVDEVLRERAALGALAFQPVQHGEKVERRATRSGPRSVSGTPKLLIENGKPRLRHNRAIEFFGWCSPRGASASGGREGSSQGALRQLSRSPGSCAGLRFCTGFIEGQSRCLEIEPISYGRHGLSLPALRQRCLASALPAAAPRSTGTATCSSMSTSTRSSPACPRTR